MVTIRIEKIIRLTKKLGAIADGFVSGRSFWIQKISKTSEKSTISIYIIERFINKHTKYS